MYEISWIDWLTKETHSIKVKAVNVSRMIAILISDVKPDEITIKVTTA